MSESTQSHPGRSGLSAEAEDHIRRFEREWLSGRRPHLEQFLADCQDDCDSLLIELVHIDLELRLKNGERIRAGDYFTRFPQLASDPAAAAELVAAEFELRSRNDPSLSIDHVASEYPEYAERLANRSAGNRWPTAPGYEILAQLGSGGMGVVYKARDVRLGRIVALKFLPPEFSQDPGRLALFHREARTASALNHPHICTVHDLGEHEGRPFIVLEYVEGRTLREGMSERVSAEEAARLIGQAARALAVAHAACVVHRDIKPENLMVRPDGYLKVLDFGLARRVPGAAPPGFSTDHSTETGRMAGTVYYMSPEQAQSQTPGPASDVFSLGVVLYELTTGSHPFRGQSPLDTLNAIVEATPVPAARLNPELPANLVSLLERMLEKDPANRPSAAEVDAALSAPGSGEVRAIRPAAERRGTVARSEQWAALEAALAAAESGSGEMVCVVGESGIGKTTLVDEFLAKSTSAQVAHGRCSERLAEAEAYLPILEALESLLRGPGGSTAARYLRTLAPSWFAELGPSQGPAPSADAAHAASQARLKRELVAFLTELARRATIVFFIDDIHWADLPTADLLAYLGRRCPGMRLLVVVAYRRDELLLSGHPFLAVQRDLQGRGVCRELVLGMFGKPDLDRYLELTFPGHAFPPELTDALHARTGGNPLFVAELVRFLRDRGIIVQREAVWVLERPIPVAGAEMPESVRGLIRRKLDQLDAQDRNLLVAAAAQSGEFDSAVLARAVGEEPATVEERLQEVERVHGLIRLLREHEFPDRTVSRRYGFVHALYQDVLSSGLAPARRAAVCRASADALLELQQGHPGLAAAELALLYEAGREFGRAADLLHAAAQNASRVFAHREATALARRGLGLLRGLHESPVQIAREFRLQMALGLQLQITDGFAAPEVEEAYLKARALWDRTPTVGPLFPIVWGLWLVAKVRSDLARAHVLAGELLALAEESGEQAYLLQARQAGTIVALCSGDPATAWKHAEVGARIYEPDHHRHLTFQFGQDPGVSCLAFGAVALWLLGDEREAIARSRDAVRLARDGSQPSTLVVALHFAAMLHQFRGDTAAVREAASESFAISVEHRFAFWQAGASVMLGWAAAADGLTDGLGVLESGIDAWRATGSATYRTYSLTLLADARARCGKRIAALAALEEAERSLTQTSERMCEPELHRLRGELVMLESKALAEESLRQAIACAEGQQAKSLRSRSALSLAKLLQTLKREDEAIAVLTKTSSLEMSPGAE